MTCLTCKNTDSFEQDFTVDLLLDPATMYIAQPQWSVALTRCAVVELKTVVIQKTLLTTSYAFRLMAVSTRSSLQLLSICSLSLTLRIATLISLILNRAFVFNGILCLQPLQNYVGRTTKRPTKLWTFFCPLDITDIKPQLAYKSLPKRLPRLADQSFLQKGGEVIFLWFMMELGNLV